MAQEVQVVSSPGGNTPCSERRDTDPSLERNAKIANSYRDRVAIWVNGHRKTTVAITTVAGMVLGAVIPGAILGAIIGALVVFACSRARAVQQESEQERVEDRQTCAGHREKLVALERRIRDLTGLVEEQQRILDQGHE
ncbi:MAG: hypothetical protein OXF02_01660 [Simkaniaceae bacterium]|nr:hypothetical protein [Simkaniaceae bacterium]